MIRIIEVPQNKISEIRGYMANSGQDCASGTCDHGQGGGHCSDSDELLTRAFEEVSADFFC